MARPAPDTNLPQDRWARLWLLLDSLNNDGMWSRHQQKGSFTRVLVAVLQPHPSGTSRCDGRKTIFC